MSLSLEQEIILQVTDKIGLGLIVGIGGLFINRIIEKHKSKEAIRQEVAKTRINKMSKIWEGLFLERLKIEALDRRATSIELDKTRRTDSNTFSDPNAVNPEALKIIQDSLLPDLLIIHNNLRKINQKIKLDHFWIGKEIKELLDMHISQLFEYVDIIQKEWSSGRKRSVGELLIRPGTLDLTTDDITSIVDSL